MAHRILERFEHLDRSAERGLPMTWTRAEAIARGLAPKTNLVVPKSLLGQDPPYRRSRLGRKRGALTQFRCHRGSYNLHIKEFARHWIVHVDRWNPHLHVVRHLLVDHGFRTFLHVAELILPRGSLALAADSWSGIVDAAPTPA